MMKLGCSVHDILGSSIYDNIKYVGEAGFDSIFLLWNDSMDTEEVMATAKNFNIAVESFHAPFVNYNSIWEEGNLGDRETEKIKKCIRVAAEYDVKTVVSHVVSDINAPLTSNLGLCRFGKIVIEAEKYGVKLAFENTEYTRHLALVFSAFDSPLFCYDAGHEHCFTPGVDHMAMFGKRLGFLHLHDNLGMNKSFRASHDDDLHRIPFDGDMDWKKVLGSIKKVAYGGSLMLECDPGHDMPLYGGLSAKEYYTKTYAAAKKLAEMYAEL
ncbi:MAG: sugar phosphate isomerase/epimerase [Ruminococcaceae bacterium]|nr:sugar phosphate isomerase/epimerase [Oscillospiraceae bacterium]